MSSSQILSSSSSSSTTYRLLTATRNLSCKFSATATLKVPSSCSLRLQEISVNSPLKSDKNDVLESTPKKNNKDVSPQDQEGEGISISRIQVPRQKYIAVSKTELLDAVVSTMFHSQDDKDQFLLISSCLDSLLHAEHKSILEEMRTDYFFSDSTDDEASASSDSEVVDKLGNSDAVSDTINGIGENDEGEETEADMLSPFNSGLGLDLWNLLGSSAKNVNNCSDRESRLAVATRFQRAFMQLLYNAQFEELSATDLMLTSALNNDYLLTLPVYVDWKRAAESNAIIFRRGYATERQKGLLIVEKLDYIQSRLLQRIFFIISKPLEKFSKWISEVIFFFVFKNASQTQEVQDSIERMKLWFEELSLFQQSYFSNEQSSDNLLGVDQLSDGELPIWLAAQKAVSRYEGLLSPVGPRGRLLRKLLTWIGLAPPTPEIPFPPETRSNPSDPYLRPIFLSRISLSDIWRPATRKYCGNDLWKMLKTSVSILLSQSILQEPSFQELILLYTDDVNRKEFKDDAEVPSLQLKIYERIPIPDLPVIFPHKKLSFRIIDTLKNLEVLIARVMGYTLAMLIILYKVKACAVGKPRHKARHAPYRNEVRLDVASILGLLAFIINYKFENLSSPSAIFLDVIAISALIIYVTRVALGYKQTWDRYQLLVNKTLYAKTLASGFGTVHFLLDASEQQQYKEALLTYAILLKEEDSQKSISTVREALTAYDTALLASCHQAVKDKCEKFMYDVFKEKVEMPVDKAVNLLVRLGMVTETAIGGRFRLQAIPCPMAHEALRARWNNLLG
ncbi:hypothetical protein JRO89_XS01G0346000 [Xanthoceras sorbifolium]|uniref:Uncharacterized protein n=1 Tax=Xanthoceras sorbifolium TaxID=99658 RepID=A0ABQ8IN55_9ROSI|nr:hypothetical protein JRO89_XS01G0346000 [Xanthoceras sorbifolium]